MKEKIAIVGGGIAGLTAAYLLNEKHDITLFEKEGRLGGNAYTYRTSDGEGIDMAVASFVQAPIMVKLLKRINVKVIRQPASALLSIHDMETNTGFYLTPLNWSGLVAQKFAIMGYKATVNIWAAAWTMLGLIRMLQQGKLAGQVEMRDEFDSTSGGLPQMIGDTIEAQNELENN